MTPIASSPLDALFSRPMVRILRYLVTHPGSYTGRALASAARVTQPRAVEALATLSAMGVIQRRRAGRAYLYSLNETSFLVSDILKPAFSREARWLEYLGAEAFRAAGRAAESVLLYGSWVRAKAAERSDIDLLVVTRTKESVRDVVSRLDEARVGLAERFGRPVSLLVLARSDFIGRIRQGDSLMRDIVREARVLHGKTLAELIRA